MYIYNIEHNLINLDAGLSHNMAVQMYTACMQVCCCVYKHSCDYLTGTTGHRL